MRRPPVTIIARMGPSAWLVSFRGKFDEQKALDVFDWARRRKKWRPRRIYVSTDDAVQWVTSLNGARQERPWGTPTFGWDPQGVVEMAPGIVCLIQPFPLLAPGRAIIEVADA